MIEIVYIDCFYIQNTHIQKKNSGLHLLIYLQAFEGFILHLVSYDENVYQQLRLINLVE